MSSGTSKDKTAGEDTVTAEETVEETVGVEDMVAVKNEIGEIGDGSKAVKLSSIKLRTKER